MCMIECKGGFLYNLIFRYVGVGESEEVQLFYYFVKSEGNPEKDPLLIWLTGGPGCSSWSGLVYEVGPLNYKIDPYNGSLPTLVLNPYSWTKISSIVFIDSPVGAGFSYAKKTSTASKTGDFKQVQGLVEFFNKWLIDHPEFISNPIYIAGDSYSGITVPVLVQKISNGIEEGILPPINLQGYILGNPVTGGDNNYRIPFAHGMALISDELHKSLERSCGGEYYENIDPSNTECLKEFQTYEECISGIWSKFILDSDCSFTLQKPQGDSISERRSLNQKSESPLPWFGCPDYPDLLSQYWANDPHVRKALHVQKGTIGEWKRCNYGFPYQYNVRSSVEYHANLSAKGYRSLIYSGDHDMQVPFLATQAWIRSLNYSIVDDWRSWVVQGHIAGYTRTYSNLMTFATVRVAGHTAPQYKPKECFAMFKRWIHYEPL
ncbi:serine carboxypeptidase-like 3 [Morus notabilis]|uniref:serine carboxypeptidase-like 3 n=1 Tax=Morus notabilis TaxID=981085 RepID=UPI000CED4FAF|nr:serine carboxypeptidase-like 3 [Morus notabilis]